MKIIKHVSTYILLLVTWSQNIQAMDSWQFKVFYGDSEIGEHHFNLVRDKGKQKVMIKADFNVNILFINVYSYKHRNTEIWKDSCLYAIESSTDDSGDNYMVTGRSENGVFKVESNLGYEEETGCVKTFAYWDKDFLDSETLLNAQTGEIVDVNIDFVANEKLLVRNKMIETERYKLKTDDFNVDLWYSKNNEWVALNSTTKDGNQLRYQIK